MICPILEMDCIAINPRRKEEKPPHECFQTGCHHPRERFSFYCREHQDTNPLPDDDDRLS